MSSAPKEITSSNCDQYFSIEFPFSSFMITYYKLTKANIEKKKKERERVQECFQSRRKKLVL